MSIRPTLNKLCCLVSPLQSLRTYIVPTKSKKIIDVYNPLNFGRRDVQQAYKESTLAKLDPTFWRRDLIKPSERNGGSVLRAGDIVRVMYNTRSIPTFTGQIVKISKKGLDSNLLLRNLISKVGVELHIKLFNPLISRIDLVRKPNKYKPRNRQYYIRGNRLDVGDLDASLRKRR